MTSLTGQPVSCRQVRGAPFRILATGFLCRWLPGSRDPRVLGPGGDTSSVLTATLRGDNDFSPENTV